MHFTRVALPILLAMSSSVIGQTQPPRDAQLKVRLEFKIEPTELGSLRDVLLKFARAEGLHVTDVGAQMPPRNGRSLFYLELNQDDSVRIDVTNIRAEQQMFVWLYQLRTESDMRELDFKLQAALRKRWPTLAPYKGS